MMFFFFNDTATTEIYTLSLHDALPISERDEDRDHEHEPPDDGGRGLDGMAEGPDEPALEPRPRRAALPADQDRKSTRLNSSHANISYAVFCLKKKTKYSLTFFLLK